MVGNTNPKFIKIAKLHSKTIGTSLELNSPFPSADRRPQQLPQREEQPGQGRQLEEADQREEDAQDLEVSWQFLRSTLFERSEKNTEVRTAC